MSTLQLTFITDAKVDLNVDGNAETVALTDIDALPADSQIRIEAAMPASGYVYAVLLDQDDNGVTVLYPANNGTRAVSKGDDLNLPDAEGWLTVPVAGQLRLVVSATPVPAAEWALLPGRDGDGHIPRNSDGAKTQEPPPQPQH